VCRVVRILRDLRCATFNSGTFLKESLAVGLQDSSAFSAFLVLRNAL
jgi:hypothetical protein